MKIDQVSAAADGANNEDLVAVFRGERCTDIVIIDGGTSVAGTDYLDGGESDVVWFVKTFSSSLRDAIRHGKPQEESVVLALADLGARFLARPRAAAMPLYAYPIAAMTWVRVTEGERCVALDIFCLGDCKTFLRRPDGSVVDLDPYTNPQELVLQRHIDDLRKAGVNDPAERLRRLMPMLRERRESQNLAPSPQVLCPLPRGPFDARKYRVDAEYEAMLFAMTDGFSRIFDTYQLRSVDSLANLCFQQGVEPALAELRGFETARRGLAGQSVKSADDASAVTCIFAVP
ncbi:MAG: hypothetical protein JWQ01_3875 [Massilia sp.]|nr:hypothetical protein [Massilia sp.]